MIPGDTIATLVVRVGFEPTTFRSSDGRSDQLSYRTEWGEAVARPGRGRRGPTKTKLIPSSRPCCTASPRAHPSLDVHSQVKRSAWHRLAGTTSRRMTGLRQPAGLRRLHRTVGGKRMEQPLPACPNVYALSTLGGSRTPTLRFLRPAALPVCLRELGTNGALDEIIPARRMEREY